MNQILKNWLKIIGFFLGIGLWITYIILNIIDFFIPINPIYHFFAFGLSLTVICLIYIDINNKKDDNEPEPNKPKSKYAKYKNCKTCELYEIGIDCEKCVNQHFYKPKSKPNNDLRKKMIMNQNKIKHIKIIFILISIALTIFGLITIHIIYVHMSFNPFMETIRFFGIFIHINTIFDISLLLIGISFFILIYLIFLSFN